MLQHLKKMAFPPVKGRIRDEYPAAQINRKTRLTIGSEFATPESVRKMKADRVSAIKWMLGVSDILEILVKERKEKLPSCNWRKAGALGIYWLPIGFKACGSKQDLSLLTKKVPHCRHFTRIDLWPCLSGLGGKAVKKTQWCNLTCAIQEETV